MNVRIINYKPTTYSPKVIAEVSVQLFDVGIIVHGVKVLKSDEGKISYAFPSSKQWDSETASWIERDGRPVYFPIVEMPIKEDVFRFSHAMDEAIEKFHATSKSEPVEFDVSTSKDEDVEGLPF